MAKELDRILVIDLEATCWEGPPPPGQQAEIIEIGLCVLDVQTGRRLENLSILVRPERTRVSQYCTSLTTLTQADVDLGISLAEACQVLMDQYSGKLRVWASYGDYDRLQLLADCERRDVEYPFGSSHINVKSLFALVCNLDAEVSLKEAMRLQGWPLEGTYHRGSDDAWNIARILGSILRHARHQGVGCD